MTRSPAIASRRRSIGLMLWAALPLLFPTFAVGHASLVQADPPANVILEAAPKILRLWYDEDLVSGLSLLSILDRSNVVMMQGGIVADGERKVLDLPVERLDPGIYTVSWKVLSAVDGHVTRGAFAFVLLPPGTDPAKLLERGRTAVKRQELGASLLFAAQVLAGWSHLIGLFVGVGCLHFLLVILGTARQTEREIVSASIRPSIALAAKAVTVALFSGILWWEINTHLTSDTTLAHFLFRPALLPFLLGARTNQSMLIRLCLLFLILVFLREAGKTSPPSLVLLGYCEAVGGVTFLALALSSHSAAAWANPLAVLFDMLHLGAGALWVGGLIALALLLPRSLKESQPRDWLPALLVAMRRFTPWAIGSVAVLILTGAIQVALHIPRPSALVQTEYGLTLLLKLLLFLPMLFLGGLNSLIARTDTEENPFRVGSWYRRLQSLAVRVQTWGIRRLGVTHWAVRGELVLGIVVLLCVAVLTRLPPPKAASSISPPTTLHARADVLTADFTIASPEGFLAPSDLTVRIQRADGRPVDGITRVTIRPSMPGMEMNVSPILGAAMGGGEYRTRMLLSMLGRWDFTVVVRRKGVEDDAVFRFPYVLLDTESGPSEVGPALPERLSVRAALRTPSTRWDFWAGVSLLLLGVGITSGLLGTFVRRRRGLLVCLAGLPLLLVGGYQVVNTMVVDTTPTAWQENPLPSDPLSLARGRELYVSGCVTCHGEHGRGAIPTRIGSSLLRGLDLTADHMEAHSDGDLFWWISKGIRGTAMPSFEDSLKPDDRWHLVNYVRSLRRPIPTTP